METSFQHHLYESREFADVTLVSEDYFSTDVHKTILAHSSTIFRRLLHISSDQKPLIYLKGIHRKELLTLVKLIYLGKAFLENDEINALFEVAKEYQIQQLHINDQSNEIDEKIPNQKLDFLTPIPTIESMTIVSMNSQKLNFLNFDTDSEEQFEKENKYQNEEHMNEDNHIDCSDKSLQNLHDPEFEPTDKSIEIDTSESSIVDSTVNEIEHTNSTEHDILSRSNETQIKKRKSKVQEEPSECKMCDRKFTTLRSFQRHNKIIHELAQVSTCSQCEKVFTSKAGLKDHVKGVHGPQTYQPCENCNKLVRDSNKKTHRKFCLKLICEFCKIKFKEEKEFHLHIKQQHIDKYLA